MKEKVRKYINKIAWKKGIKVQDETDLFAESILDSMEIISLLVYLQKEFAIDFSPEDLKYENYQTVNSISKWLNEVLG